MLSYYQVSRAIALSFSASTHTIFATQGYHDVISVLLVCLSPTLPETHDAEGGEEALWSSEEEGEMIAQAAERLSLHWLRDFMASNLEPALGALK